MNSTPPRGVDSGMSDKNLPARRYDDKEIARLLKRATELQAHEPHRVERDGMTLAELEAIAREAGIDPSLLQQAASELDREPSNHGWIPHLVGETPSLIIERAFEGELATNDLEGLVPLVNVAADTTGNVSLVGRTLNFSGGGQQSARSVQILITGRDGRTQLRIEERYGQLLGGLYGGIVGGGGVGMGIGVGAGIGTALGSAIFVVGIPIALFSSSYVIARTLFRTIVRKRRKALTRLVDQVAEAVAAHGMRTVAGEPHSRKLPPAL